MDSSEYVRIVLQPADAQWPPDEFARYGLPVDVSDQGEIEVAIRLINSIWSGLLTNPKWAPKIGFLRGEGKRVEEQLRNPTQRSALRNEVLRRRYEATRSRYIWLDEWIVTRKKERGAVMNPDDQASLVRLFAPEGITEAEINARLEANGVRVDHATEPQPDEAVASWRSPPPQLKTKAAQQDEKQKQHTTKGKATVADFLGIGVATSADEVRLRREALEREVGSKGPTPQKAAAERLLALLSPLKDDAKSYELLRQCEAERLLRPHVEDACRDGRVSIHEQELLLRRARHLGEPDAWCWKLVRQVARETGATIDQAAVPQPNPEQQSPPPPRPRSGAQADGQDSPDPRSKAGTSGDGRDRERVKPSKPVNLPARKWTVAAFGLVLLSLLLISVGAGAVILAALGALYAARKAWWELGNRMVIAVAGVMAIALVVAGIGMLIARSHNGRYSEREDVDASPPSARVDTPPAPPRVDRQVVDNEKQQTKKQTERGEFAEAIPRFREALQHAPSRAEGWSNLAWAYYRTGSLESAEEAAKKVGETTTDPLLTSKAAYCLGRVAETRGQLEQAGKLYDEALAQRPDNKEITLAIDTLAIINAPRPELMSAVEKVLKEEILEDEDIAPLRPEEVRLVRNAPFARHHKDFHEPGLNNFFYRGPPPGDSTYRNSDLTDADRANLVFFKEYTRQHAASE